MWVEAVLAMVLLVLLVQMLKRPHGLPPGRWGLPLVGYIPLSTKNPEEQLMDLQKKHGDIYMWRIGTQMMVFLHDYHLTKETFSKADFVDRPQWSFFDINEPHPLGVGGSSGIRWHNNRRFSLQQLRDLGMGKSKLVAAVHVQAKRLVEEMKGQAGKVAPLPHAISVAVVNIIWQMVGSTQFAVTDPKYKEFQNITEEFFNVSFRMVILDFMPWIANVLPSSLLNWIFRMDFTDFLKEKFFSYFKEVIDEHRTTLNREDPRDLIDSYLIEIEERKDDSDSTFDEKDLCVLLLDLFFAGQETTTSTLKYMFYYLADNQRVQTKIQAEIDEVLAGKLATLEDRSRMPYTEAVIHEVMRMSSLLPLSLQHVASRETQIAGYTIPKGSIMNSVVVSIHHDRRYWDDPHQFLPERWLNQDGHFNTKKEGFLPFGVGKRQCLGEALARMELLIFSSAVLQSVSFAPSPGKTINISHQASSPFFHSPIEHDLLITVRN